MWGVDLSRYLHIIISYSVGTYIDKVFKYVVKNHLFNLRNNKLLTSYFVFYPVLSIDGASSLINALAD